MGRFINADTITALTINLENHYNKNLYAYTDNNPVNRIDCGGNVWQEVLAFAGITAAADGPLPFGDIIAAGIVIIAAPIIIYESITITPPMPTTLPPRYPPPAVIPQLPTVGPINISTGLKNIAKAFGILKCIDAANAMQKYLQDNNKRGAVITITFSGYGSKYENYIMSNSQNRIISKNGLHTGILWNGKVSPLWAS